MKKLILKSENYQYIENSFREWLDVLGYAPSTVYQLPTHIRELFYYLEQKGITHINQVDTKQIKEFYNQLKTRTNQRFGGGLSNAYLNKHLQALYKFSDYLRQSGRLILPSLNIEWEANDTEEITYLTQDEIKELFAATYGFNEGTKLEPLNIRDRAIISIFYGCGLRRNEGFSLDINDINFDRRIVHVRKGKAYKERFVPFNKANAKYLEEYLYDCRPVLVMDRAKVRGTFEPGGGTEEAFFISQRGKRMETQSMGLRLKLLQQRTDNIALQEKNVRLHVLRHSIATHLLQNGMSLEKISRFLGHSSLESTQVYTHIVEAEKNGTEPILKPQIYNNINRYPYAQIHEDER